MDTNKKAKVAGVSMVEAKKLRPHPKNPRKSLGDLTELTESIKKNGIMQNLTAVPDPDKEDGYMIIIGHRRFAAGKKAGLKEFPVSIACLDEADQIKIMLCENIQRSDLTAIEQAEGFQMMIDFGITVQELSEETGFAPSTIYHRLNLAKLDRNALKKKMDQLTITDLIELEQIEDVQTRNEILKKANRQTFAQMVQSAVNDQKKAQNETAFVERLKAAGLTERPGRSWDSDVGGYTNVYISATEDGSTVDLKGYEHFIRSEYNSSYLIYAMKQEEAENSEKDELDKKMQDIRDIIGDAREQLDAKAFDIQQEIDAFVETVSKGDYIKDRRDEFIAECFILAITYTIEFDLTHPDAFESKAFGLNNRWNYEGTLEEWREEMESCIRERYGNDPAVYAALTLAESLAGIHLAKGYADGVMRGISEFYAKDNAENLNRAIRALEIIGFSLSDDLKKYLTEDNEIVKKVEKAKADYESLKGDD